MTQELKHPTGGKQVLFHLVHLCICVCPTANGYNSYGGAGACLWVLQSPAFPSLVLFPSIKMLLTSKGQLNYVISRDFPTPAKHMVTLHAC